MPFAKNKVDRIGFGTWKMWEEWKMGKVLVGCPGK